MLLHHDFEFNEEFKLESGKSLPGFTLRYTTYGTFDPEKNNIIWVCHAFSGSSNFLDWWDGLFGEGKLYDPDQHYIVCANMLGGCYGSTGPLSINPNTGTPWFHSFPLLTNKDMVASFELLRKHLNIEKIHTVIGCSMGGQHALEWSVEHPDVFEHVVSIGSNAKHSPWAIAFNETQRLAIQQDLTWKLNTENAGINGMKVARAIALISYRNYHTYEISQTEETDEKFDGFKASSYQVYQGEKLAKRFNAFSYWYLSKAMDSQNLGRGRGGIKKALQQIKAKCLFVGIESDILFPMKEQQFLADNVLGATFDHLDSAYGHDGFLIECDKLTKIIKQFYKSKELKPELI